MEEVPKSIEVNRRATSWKAVTEIAALAALSALSQITVAGEGGTTHIIPGVTATLSDLPGTAPGWFVKPMLMNWTSPIWYTPGPGLPAGTIVRCAPNAVASARRGR